jgi:hypothetical protein
MVYKPVCYRDAGGVGVNRVGWGLRALLTPFALVGSAAAENEAKVNLLEILYSI